MANIISNLSNNEISAIFAKAKLILRNGFTIEYKCITQLEVKSNENGVKFLYITGETLDLLGMPRINYDKHFTTDILILITEFYLSKT